MSTTQMPHAAFHASTESAAVDAAIHGPVVLASDGADATPSAALVAQRVARRADVALDVVAAVAPLQVYTAGWDVPVMPAESEEERRATLQDTVVRSLEPVLGPPDRWLLDVRSGPPALEITEAARARHASLIVINSGRHGVIDRLLREEMSMQVIRHTDTPVLAVAEGDVRPFRHALVGMDFSAASIRAAIMALALLEPQEDTGATLTLVHVQPSLDEPPSILAAWTVEYEDRMRAMMKRVKALLGPLAPARVRIESVMHAGTVAGSLHAMALHSSADLIAVGTRSAGWLDRIVVGSVATSVLRHSTVSVLVAPRPEPAERIRLELRVAGRVALEESTDWGAAMRAFTDRNTGRPARLELSGHGLHGFAVQSEGYRFQGADYDPQHRHVDIMLGGQPESRHHLTHGIANIRSVSIVAGDDLHDRSLVIEEPHGEAVLTFVD